MIFLTLSVYRCIIIFQIEIGYRYSKIIYCIYILIDYSFPDAANGIFNLTVIFIHIYEHNEIGISDKTMHSDRTTSYGTFSSRNTFIYIRLHNYEGISIEIMHLHQISFIHKFRT